MMTSDNAEQYLSHHGVLGQKWGVRRYQNSDGTLTDAGKKRYNKQVKKLDKLERNAERKEKKADRYGDRPWVARNRGTHSDKVIKALKARRKYNKYAEKLIEEYGDVTLEEIKKEKKAQ